MERRGGKKTQVKLFQLICQWVQIFWIIKNVLYQDNRIQSCGAHPCVRLEKNYPKNIQLTLLVNLESILSHEKKKGIHSLHPSSTMNSFLNPPSSSSKVLLLLSLFKKKIQNCFSTVMDNRNDQSSSETRFSLSLSLSLSLHTHQIQFQ